MFAAVLHHITFGVLAGALIVGNVTVQSHVVAWDTPLYVAAIEHNVKFLLALVYVVPAYVKLVFQFK